MCTLIALFRVNPDAPLVVGANRDEFYARKWAPPTRLSEQPRIYGGVDLVQGGTWLGVTDTGFFAGVTNQRTYGPADPSKLSRGHLVRDVLSKGSVASARSYLEGVAGRDYNPWNLLFGDARELFVAYARDGASVRVEPLSAGVWVLNNDTIGSRDFPKANRARDLLAPFVAAPFDELAARVTTVLGDHELPPVEEIPPAKAESMFPHDVLCRLQAQCVHTPVYGTTSSTLLAIGEKGILDYRFAAGPPCVTPFATVSER